VAKRRKLKKTKRKSNSKTSRLSTRKTEREREAKGRKKKEGAVKSKGDKKNKKMAPKAKKENSFKYPLLTSRLKRWISAILMMVGALIISLSFFKKAGRGGEFIFESFNFLIGKAVFFIPPLLVIGGILFWKPQKKRIFLPIWGAILIFIVGICGLLAIKNFPEKEGGVLGYFVAWPLFNFFGAIVSFVVFLALILIGGLILWEFAPKGVLLSKKEEESKPKLKKNKEKFGPKEEKKRPLQIKIVEVPRSKKQKEKEEEKDRETLTSQPVFSKSIINGYKVPPLDFFDTSQENPITSGDITNSALIIKKTLKNFGIEVEMSDVNIGPSVTQYTLKPAEGIKLSKITSLSNDLALALAAHPVRIEAPIPGKPLVGIEVPNKVKACVKLGTLLSAKEFKQSPDVLTIALGKDVTGRNIFASLEKMPHLLVAGSTGSGKTICLNSIIMSLIYRNSPKMMRLILVDPKRVEFSVYSSLPHLLTPIIYDAHKVINALKWLIGEMERRFELLKEAGARDIVSYNEKVQKRLKGEKENLEILPYIVVIIDELADLMAARGRDIEGGIVRLSQLARAVGIHLVVATQRPSVEVITGLIKANITSRIAFQVASQVDSRTILDTAGAEKLLGRGDMLFLSSEFSKPKRIQGSFVSTSEVRKIVEYISRENSPESQEDIDTQVEQDLQGAQEIGLDEYGSAEDPLYEEAKQVVLTYRKASASLLQRRLKIGYARAARLLDMLEENGIVGPAQGAKPREVYIGNEEDSGSAPEQSDGASEIEKENIGNREDKETGF